MWLIRYKKHYITEILVMKMTVMMTKQPNLAGSMIYLFLTQVSSFSLIYDNYLKDWLIKPFKWFKIYERMLYFVAQMVKGVMVSSKIIITFFYFLLSL